MRTRSQVEQDVLAVLADEHRCSDAGDEAGVEMCCDRLLTLQLEWASIPLQLPEPRPASG